MCVVWINNPTYLTEQHLHKADLKCFQAAESLKLNMSVVENSGSHVGFCIGVRRDTTKQNSDFCHFFRGKKKNVIKWPILDLKTTVPLAS